MRLKPCRHCKGSGLAAIGGVSYHKRERRWQARLLKSTTGWGYDKHIGMYKTLWEAEVAVFEAYQSFKSDTVAKS